MRIFVAYGFNDRDKWIENLLFPIIRAFGDEVITGEELHGDQITDAVIQKIRQSNALIGFATRRGDPIGPERWITHRWVTDEISQALANRISVIEVRERGVDDQGGIVGDRQHIIYDESERDKCLVELVKAIGKWHQKKKIKLQLLPQEHAQEIIPMLRNPDMRCTYKFLVDGDVSREGETTILPITGGLFVEIKDVPLQALVQVHVKCEGKNWVSSFESTDSIGILLRKD